MQFYVEKENRNTKNIRQEKKKKKKKTKKTITKQTPEIFHTSTSFIFLPPPFYFLAIQWSEKHQNSFSCIACFATITEMYEVHLSTNQKATIRCII